ncbi:CARDB domain-containing protein [Methanobrevibacter cuticularis]|uniref:CARDB domain-containing protein n=1 Tax=Methanobrevibacter cuticularis TaxID=47311 RepID=UPI0014724243|nr:CARDB domain-containing protein [Methanobrevibacter cuticularis]
MFLSVNYSSALTHQKKNAEFSYSTKNKAYNIYYNDVAGFILTKNYKQISFVKITDIEGNSKTLKNKIHFKNNKTIFGYTADINFNKNDLKLNKIRKIEVSFVRQPNLRISKIVKKSNFFYITVKNSGDFKAESNYLGVYVQKSYFDKQKFVKKIRIPALKPGQSKKIKFSMNKKYKKYLKKASVDYKKRINEIYKYNNSRLFF